MPMKRRQPSVRFIVKLRSTSTTEVTSQGVDVTLDNQSDVDVESVELRSNDIPNLTINQNVQRVERVSAGESKTLL